MVLIDTIFVVVTFFWIAEFFLFRQKAPSKEPERTERRSFRWILTAIILSMGTAVVFGETGFLSLSSVWLQVAGLCLYGAGIGLRYWGILHLREQFSRDVSVRNGDRLVSSGPYRRLCHPLYTALFFIVLGFCLFMNSPGAAVISTGVMVPALLYRIRIEEEMLRQTHGDTYRLWCRQRNRLIPFLY